MTTDTSVVYFDSTMSGAPTLSGTAGALISVLDACLVNGFGSVTLDSLIVASDVATATVSGGHHLAMVGNTGPVVRISGATPSGLNGDWRIATIPTSTTFTFTTSGISNQTATGTITAKRKPAGFEKTWSGTNLAAYRSLDVQSTQLYLRVDDTTTNYATIWGYESVDGSGVGTDSFSPTLIYCTKSNQADATSRPWRLIADSQGFYFIPRWHSTYPGGGEGYWFGDIVSYREAGDAYRCAIIGTRITGMAYPGGNSTDQNEFWQINSTGQTQHQLSRNYGLITKQAAFNKYTHSAAGPNFGVGSASYPDPMNHGLIITEVQVLETGAIRGRMPGWYASLMTLIGGVMADGTVVLVPEVGDVISCSLQYSTSPNASVALFGIETPWR